MSPAWRQGTGRGVVEWAAKMIYRAYFEEMDRKIQEAGVAELLEIRKSALDKAGGAEQLLIASVEKGQIPWREDAAFIYRKRMEWAAECCLRLAAIYGKSVVGA